ncbi:MAG: SMP-30/gluconolactonase/LRE family protein [Bryobacter sp.]
MTRRTLFSALAAAPLAAPLVAPLAAQTPGRDYSGKTPIRYPEPDVVVLDPRFAKIKIGNTTIQRLASGFLWAEGPAWHGGGKYLVWSDIPNNRQHRWIEDDGHVSVIHQPAGYSNGNTFDYQGRQISCEHGNRRVLRYELNGTTTVLADKFEGKPFNAPNDAVVHPDGGIWFTDPGYGILLNYEGHKAELQLKEAVYRIDPSGSIAKVTDEIGKPNGLCFSPDYTKLYVADTGSTHNPSVPKIIKMWDVVGGKSLRSGKQFCSMELPGKGAGLADGIRADKQGNIYAGAGWVGEGYDGVHVFAPDGQRIGLILLPEICANICFGGTRRNRLFMCGSQSLYAVYLEAEGAHIC